MAEIVTINGKKYRIVSDAETICNACDLNKECRAAVDNGEEALCDGIYECHFEEIV